MVKPSKYFGTSEGVVELRPFKTDDGLTMYRPVTYPCPDGLERYQGFALQVGKFQTVVSLGIGAGAIAFFGLHVALDNFLGDVVWTRGALCLGLVLLLVLIAGWDRVLPGVKRRVSQEWEKAIEGLESSVAGPSTVSSIDW